MSNLLAIDQASVTSGYAIFKDGNLVYELPNLEQIRTYCLQQVDSLWDEVKRFDNPHNYYVDLSQKLWDIKYGLLKDNSK